MIYLFIYYFYIPASVLQNLYSSMYSQMPASPPTLLLCTGELKVKMVSIFTLALSPSTYQAYCESTDHSKPDNSYSKSRSIKVTFIPRLELQAALLGTRRAREET